MSFDRQEKALREFKQIMADLVHLLRTSTQVELAYMCWVNHAREQFVWESNSTGLKNVMFKDRIAFDFHFLNDYKEIDEIVQLKIGKDIAKGKLVHYLNFVSAEHMLIIPFINKGKTVALTVLESEHEISSRELSSQLYAYNNALVNVLDTYLEVVDMHEKHKEWEEYEQSLAQLDYRLHKVDLLANMMEEMQSYLPNGGVCLVVQTMESWTNVLTSQFPNNAPSIGLMMDDISVAYDALEKGMPVFNMHFNNNPKLISSQESKIDGASYAIPIMVHDRRQAVIVTYDSDPLTFKSSTKHKLSNLARVASLSIQSVVKKVGVSEELLTENFGAIMPELWEKALEYEIKKTQSGNNTNTWFGFITPEDVSTLRTKHRLEELHRIQKDFVSFLNPSKHGIPGYLGFQSDYIYAFIIQHNVESAINDWLDSIRIKLAHGLRLSAGGTINTSFNIGFTKLTSKDEDAYQIVTKAKKALNEVVKKEDIILYEV